MNGYLQMTFVPHIENGWNFYLWLTDKNGEPLPFASHAPSWLGDRSPYRFFPSQAGFITGSGKAAVSGIIMTMSSAFQIMRDGRLEDRSGEILPGKTFQWFSQISDAVQILLDRGHFYPYFYHLERGNHERCYFCEWMPDAKLIVQSGLFTDWLSRLPRLALSLADLQDEKVRQWLYLIVIFWTNTLIRDASADLVPSGVLFPNAAGALKSSSFEKRLATEFPFSHFGKPWIVSDDPDQIKELDLLEKETAGWVRPAATEQAWNRALLDYRKKQQETYFAPERVLILLEPVDSDQLFSPDSLWDCEPAIRGWQNGRQLERPLRSLEQSIQPLQNSSWFDNQLKSLKGRIPADVLQLLGARGYLTSAEVSDLFQCKDALASASIDLVFPDGLNIRSASRSVAVDLMIGQDSGHQDSLFSLASLINYDWRIAIGDIRLSAGDFMRLVKENQSFIRHGSEWIHLPMKQMMKAYEEMGETIDLFDKKPSVAGALRLQAARLRKRNRKITVHLDSSLDDYLSRLLKKPVKNIALPEGFRGRLRPYQEKGYAWLVSLRHRHVGGCLADDMGLGKTVQAIAYLDYCRAQPADPLPGDIAFEGPSLIVCPTSLVSNWKHEFRIFAPLLNIYAHHGGSRLHGDALIGRLKQADVMITSYAIFTREAPQLRQVYWKSVILDEAQAIKNPHAQKTQALRPIQTAHRLVLTGTPIENRLEELWSIMDFLNPGYLGSLEHFRRQFIRPVEKKNNGSKAGQLTKIIQPFLLRREKTDKRIIRDLPDKIETKKTCFLSKDQASLYQSFVNRLARNVGTAEGIQRKGLILSTLTKLKQICDHPALVLDQESGGKKSGKLQLFFDLLDPLFSSNEKVLVFTQYVQMGKLLLEKVKNRYPDATVLFLNGSLSAEQRENMIRRFQSGRREKTLFILSLKAGGVGINLTEAGYVIHYDRWWNPAVEEQATDRAYRIGQNRNVHVYKLICEGTLEERIDQLIERKKELQRQILGQSDAWLTEMTDKEIFDLIKLREGVV